MVVMEWYLCVNLAVASFRPKCYDSPEKTNLPTCYSTDKCLLGLAEQHGVKLSVDHMRMCRLVQSRVCIRKRRVAR